MKHLKPYFVILLRHYCFTLIYELEYQSHINLSIRLLSPLLRGSVCNRRMKGDSLVAGLVATLAPAHQLLQKSVTKLKSDSTLEHMLVMHVFTHIMSVQHFISTSQVCFFVLRATEKLL